MGPFGEKNGVTLPFRSVPPPCEGPREGGPPQGLQKETYQYVTLDGTPHDFALLGLLAIEKANRCASQVTDWKRARALACDMGSGAR